MLKVFSKSYFETKFVVEKAIAKQHQQK